MWAKRGRLRPMRLVELDLAEGVGQVVVAADDVGDRPCRCRRPRPTACRSACRRPRSSTMSSSCALATSISPCTRSSRRSRRSAAPAAGPRRRRPAGASARVAVAPAAVVADRQALGALPARASPPAPRAWRSSDRPCPRASSCRATSAWRPARANWNTGGSSGVEPEPAQPVEDRVDRRLRGALAVGVLDAQQVAAAMVAGEQPVEQRRPRAADVEITCRRRCEPDNYTHG